MKKISLIVALLSLTFGTIYAQESILSQTPQTDSVYRLPLEKGIIVSANELSPLAYGIAQHFNSVDFCAWEFTSSKPSAVCAARGGKVEFADANSAIVLHDDGTYAEYTRLEEVVVVAGDRLDRGDILAQASLRPLSGKWSVRMAVYYHKPNPAYGGEGRSSQYKTLMHYINPIFTTKGKCKVMLTDGNTYSVRARTWCWPWE
ncbi:MAG: hypothetical protein IIX81_01515 [Tidjanibacter sp.]|nr:hypothetical protein [Tidjanibacter sp.]